MCQFYSDSSRFVVGFKKTLRYFLEKKIVFKMYRVTFND
jgi:hypothetical protein